MNLISHSHEDLGIVPKPHNARSLDSKEKNGGLVITWVHAQEVNEMPAQILWR